MPNGPSRPTRRTALKTMAAGGAVAWTAPQIISIPAAAAASVTVMRLVSVGSSGTVITSNDAITWTLQTTPTTNNLKSVAWSPTLGLFAAVGSGGTIITSPDGVNWTTRTSPVNRNLGEVNWLPGPAIFSATGAGHTVITSSDGITWTLREADLLSDDLLGVAFSPTLPLVVAVGVNGAVTTSPDSNTWTDSSTGGTNIMRDVEWSPTLALFVAMGDNGEAFTSPDGTTWTPVTTGTLLGITAVEWNSTQGQFVAVLDGTGGALTSPDGVNWTVQAMPTASFKDVTFSATLALWIACGSSGTIATSTTGAPPWATQVTPTNQNLEGIVATD